MATLVTAYIFDWLQMLVRWLHVIAGVAWIGSSFYFVWLDNHLRPPEKTDDVERGVHGRLWAVHGGGFYRNEKYLVGPKNEPLSQDLHWFKWEAYWTWISGTTLLMLIYWYGARSFLIDPSIANLSPVEAIAISFGFLVGGWVIYNELCKLVSNERTLGILVFVLIVIADWALFHLFSARAAYIHVGAIIGTIMAGNVYFVIIPGQKKMVEAIRGGREPDPGPGIEGKKRSVHNTYLTLPLIYIMISNHYPMTYNHRYGWQVLVAIMGAGVLIRQFFVLRQKGETRFLFPTAAGAILLAVAVVIAPAVATGGVSGEPVDFAEIEAIIAQRCAVCHSARPTSDVFTTAPGGVMFDTPDQIQSMAPRIYQRAAVTKDMPFGNLTNITEEERAIIAAWFDQGAHVDTP